MWQSYKIMYKGLDANRNRSLIFFPAKRQHIINLREKWILLVVVSRHVFFHVALHEAVEPVALAHITHELDGAGLRRGLRPRGQQQSQQKRGCAQGAENGRSLFGHL